MLRESWHQFVREKETRRASRERMPNEGHRSKQLNTSWMAAVWVAMGGAFGSVVRYGVGRLCSWCLPNAPSVLGTGLVNLVGSFLLGVVVASFPANPKPSVGVMFLGVGFCGGLTTFSTLAMELADLMHQRRFLGLIGYGAGSLALGLLAFLAGLWIASKS